MTSRDAILSAVRAARPPLTERPGVGGLASGPADSAGLVAEFTRAGEVASARVLGGQRADLATLVASIYQVGGRRVSAMDLATAADGSLAPHSFADTEVFVCEGVLGVAENGAIWLPLSRLRHRSALVLALNVIIVLDEARIVRTLHDAYDRIDPAAEPFGVFVAGPSKTADIEQALVIGAHGAKSLTVLLVRD